MVCYNKLSAGLIYLKAIQTANCKFGTVHRGELDECDLFFFVHLEHLIDPRIVLKKLVDGCFSKVRG